MGALLADIAHQLNNPLSIILGHAALLSQTLADAPSGEQAEKIVKEQMQEEAAARLAKEWYATHTIALPQGFNGFRILPQGAE